MSVAIPTRFIDVTFQLGEGTFGEQLGDRTTISGLKVQATISVQGADAQGVLQARIWGLPLTVINKLTTAGPVGFEIKGKNTITLAAGTEAKGQPSGRGSAIFEGAIVTAMGEMQSAPDVVLSVFATSIAAARVRPVAAFSQKGAADVATIMQALANSAGFGFVNHGVKATLSNPNFPGSAASQISTCAAAAGIGWSVEGGVLHIWPGNGYRSGDVPVLSPDAGLVGYPTFSSQYLELRSEFQPTAVIGGRVTVAGSAIDGANGTWGIAGVTHNITSQTPGGPWFTDVSAYSLGI